MWFLFLQIWVWLLAAFILGWLAHWFLCCRTGSTKKNRRDQQAASLALSASDKNAATEVSAAALTDSDPSFEAEIDSWKPVLLAAAPENQDDLKRIKGIGNVLEATLNELGVYQFQQIAAWTDENVAWVDNFLSFPGRVEREDWRNQAELLAAGGTTEFAERVNKGDLDY